MSQDDMIFQRRSNNLMSSITSNLSRRAIMGATAASAIAFPFVARGAATPVPQATPVPPDTLRSAIRQAMTDHVVPGCVVSLEHPGADPWLEAFGLADIESGEPVTIDHHFRIGSITKTFTATVILKLIDDGTLQLDEPVSTFRDDIPNGDTMTLQHLLGMRSGLFDLLDDPSVFPRLLADPTKPFPPEEQLQVGLSHPPDFAPGEKFAYSNTNYALLQIIAEQVTGTPLDEQIALSVLSPTGLVETTWPMSPDLPNPFAHGYIAPPPPDDATPVPGASPRLVDFSQLDPSIGGGAGALQSTIGDLRTWLHTLIDGTLLSPALQRQRLTFPPAEKPGQMRYGLGIANMDGWIGHDGAILGYQGYMAHQPDAETSIVVLANIKPGPDNSNAANEIAYAIQDVLGLR
jgi:D-alanyl-D-alanine carboxypeptidase